MSATAEKIETENLPALPEITPEQWPAIYEGGDYLSNFIQRVRDEVGNEVPDLATKKGRARVASLAAQVSKAKAAVEKPGRDYLRDIKAKVKPIEENIREFVRAMDALRDEVRAPLTEWEDAEEKRKQGHKEKIDLIKALTRSIDGSSSDILRGLLDAAEDFNVGPSYEEFEGEAATALLLTQKTLRDALAKREAYEAEQAAQEAERQRLAEERRQIELEKAKQEAADKARADAEAKAKADQEAAQRREIEARMAQERAEREAEAAKQREEQAKADAAAQAERAAQAAAEAERKRIADEDAAKAAEEKRRQEDQEHRAAINRAALADLMALELDEATAKRVLIGIIQGKVANVSVKY